MTIHTPALTGMPLETKSEAEGHEAPAGDVAEAVAAALEGLRTDVFGRLEALETKAEDTSRRLARPAILAGIETKAEDAGALERKAFSAFIRRGAERLTADETKALTVSVDADGGYLAPVEISSELLKLTTEFSPIRKYARVVTTGSQATKYPRRVSGVTATWTDETAERTEDEPRYEQVTLTPYELALSIPFSRQLLEDNAYNLEGELALEFADAFGKAEGTAFVTGSGVGQPKGILKVAGIAEFKTGAAAGFPEKDPADVIVNMFHKLPSVHAQNGVWMANRKTIGLMRTWKDGNGRHLLADPLTATAPTTLYGRPVVECMDMPDVAAGSTPLVFGDLSGYRIVDRIQPTFLRDPFTLAGKGLIRIIGHKRVGADVTHPDRFLKLKVAA